MCSLLVALLTIIINHDTSQDRRRSGDSLPEPLLSYHRYADVIMSLAEYRGFAYHAVIHSDLDTFLMPGKKSL